MSGDQFACTHFTLGAGPYSADFAILVCGENDLSVIAIEALSAKTKGDEPHAGVSAWQDPSPAANSAEHPSIKVQVFLNHSRLAEIFHAALPRFGAQFIDEPRLVQNTLHAGG